MAKQTSFEFPPEGHVALLVYDTVNNDWYAVLGDSDGHLKVDIVVSALPSGAATEAKQLPNDHDVNVSNMITGFATAAKQLAAGHDVHIDNTDLEVFQDTPSALLMGQHQYDGVAWRKSNLLWGFNDTVSEVVTAADMAEGENVLLGAQVPTGEVWRITVACISTSVNVTGRAMIQGVVDSINITLLRQSDPVAWVDYPVLGEVTLAKDDRMRGYIYTAAAGGNGYLYYAGYKMHIDM